MRAKENRAVKTTLLPKYARMRHKVFYSGPFCKIFKIEDIMVQSDSRNDRIAPYVLYAVVLAAPGEQFKVKKKKLRREETGVVYATTKSRITRRLQGKKYQPIPVQSVESPKQFFVVPRYIALFLQQLLETHENNPRFVSAVRSQLSTEPKIHQLHDWISAVDELFRIDENFPAENIPMKTKHVEDVIEALKNAKIVAVKNIKVTENNRVAQDLATMKQESRVSLEVAKDFYGSVVVE